MAVTLASEDRMGTFNEIIYSVKTIESLIDSLQLNRGLRSEADKQRLIKTLRNNIEVDRHGTESFSIIYTDNDPVRAQRAVSILTDILIQTKLSVANEQNERTVEFFEKKLEEFRDKFENSQNIVVSQMKERINTLPVEDRLLYARLDNIEQQIGNQDVKIKTYQQALSVLRTYPEALHTEKGKQALYEFERAELPFVSDLRALVAKYDDYITRYTSNYPEVKNLESQTIEVLSRMKNAVDSEISRLQARRWDLEKERDQVVSNLKQSTITERVDQDKESNYSIYRQLYDEMKIKLEQARTTRDLGSHAAYQFNIIDPALVPTEATKPNRTLIVVAGFGLGLGLGFILVILSELFDTTVRTSKDIEFYQKPVIALIPEGFKELEN